MKQKIIFCLLMLVSLSSYAQQRTELRGNVVNSVTNEPVIGVVVTLRGQNQSEVTNTKGEFHFISVSPGEDVLALSSTNIIPAEILVNMESDATALLKDIKVLVVETSENMALMNIMDESLVDDEGSTQEISSMIILSNDVYLNKAGYQLSAFRFKVRGYDNIYQGKYINGIQFNDQNRGVFNYSAIGALNDLTRNGDVVNYQTPNTFTYGNIGGSENINMRAGSFARGGKVTLSYTNRSYYLRGMASYSSGLMDDGYAFTVALGGRYSDEGNVDGTYYRNMSYALGMEKQWNDGEHSISFTTYGSPVERGQHHSSYQEAYDLIGDNLYNPNWGFQNGKKRNARVVKAFDPTAILSHVWKINRDMTLTTGIATHYGYYGSSALNWYNGADPRPDYYRYLPSYFEDKDISNNYAERWRSKDSKLTQIDWDDLIRQNKTAPRPASSDPHSAIYMVEDRRSDLFETTLNSTVNLNLPNNMKITGGIGLRTSESKQFKTVKDLLGSAYLVDIDKYADRDFGGDTDIKQNDLNKPDRKVYKDDIFGYDFRLNINSGNAWIQNQHSTRNLDINYGAKLVYTEFQRKGKMKNGRYADNSYGKGDTHHFTDFGLKGGATYKFSGRHFLTGNISFSTEAPLPNNAYISPRITDNTVDLNSGKIFSADISYVFSLPSVKGRVSVFQTNFYDMMHKVSYYHDSQRTFIHHILTGMNKVNRGVELGLSYRLNTNWSFDLAGTIAEYYYANNPDGTISAENGKEPNSNETVYLKDYYVGGTPQIAGTLGINYFYDFWFLNLSVNGLGRNYIDVAPLRRLSSNYSALNPNKPADLEAYKTLTHQERFGSNYTLDFSIGKILYLPNKQSINLNLAFNNILNRENIRTGGYEQGRIDVTAPNKFQSKYYYMQGFNCFINASYRFR